jgi:putative hydrolase of the HAD superfamily
VCAAVSDIAAVLFDAGGVLVAPDPIVIQLAFDHHVPLADVLAAHYVGMRALDESEATDGRVDWTDYRTALARRCGVERDGIAATVERLSAIWSPYLWRFPIHASLLGLHLLRAAGVPIGVVSNASGQIEGLLANLGVCQIGPGAGVPVSCVIDSHVVGVAKPDPRIFDGALAALGVPADRVAYVGDSVRFDVASATAAGIRPLLLDPYGVRDDARAAGVRTIASVRELLALTGR